MGNTALTAEDPAIFDRYPSPPSSTLLLVQTQVQKLEADIEQRIDALRSHDPSSAAFQAIRTEIMDLVYRKAIHVAFQTRGGVRGGD